MNDYQRAIEFLDSFLNYEQITAYSYPGAFSLDRVERLLEGLGNPHRKYPVLHVAGTKGKGSTCAFTASILRAAGLRTGLYTSPHLLSFRERIQVDGRPISEQDLAAVVERLRPLAGKELTYFEAVTVCAFLHFEKAGVEAAVIEVGMGGRLDATNVVAPKVTAITPVSLDHLPKLGTTVGQIAREKAGILKRGILAVIAPQASEAMRVIEEAAALRGAVLHPVDREVRIEVRNVDTSGSLATFETPVRRYQDLAVPLLGRHQLMNAAVAIRMAELFRGSGSLESSIREGIAATRWSGRCQIIPGDPPVLLDGAQNAESALALRSAAEDLFPGRRVVLVVGASTEKDLEGMARIWGPWADRIILTQSKSPRAEPASRLQEVFSRFHPPAERSGSVREALQRAVEEASPREVVVVSGSLFVVGEALEALRSSTPPIASSQGITASIPRKS